MNPLDLPVTAWRKSSYSTDTGGNCVELAGWRKSSHSGDTGGACVELADLSCGVAVRDSKHAGGPALFFSAADFAAAVTRIKQG